MKKRFLSILLVVTLLVSLLSGCAAKEKTAEVSGTPDVTEAPTEKVTLTYANWNLGTSEENNLERRMIKTWNEANPNIQVEIDESMDYSKYSESLTAAASAGTLPDVFALPNIPLGLSNEWLVDISEQTSSDNAWNEIPKPLEQATHYDNGIYAVPFGMFFMGYFVNDDLFQNNNVDSLKFAPSFDEFMGAVKANYKPAENILGLSESLQIPEWYAASQNENFGWFTFDGSKYNLDSPEFKTGISKAKEVLANKYTFDALTEEQKVELNAGWHGDLWNQGKVAVRWDGTWATPDFSKADFDNRFIGIPGGRTAVVGDYLGISKSSKNVNAAYEFAKYMSFSKDGIMARMELGAVDNSFNSLPLTTNQEVLNKYFETFKYKGIKEAFDTISNGIVEGVKIVPGYIQSRWEATTGIKVGDVDNANMGQVIEATFRGNLNIEDIAGQLNKLANDEYNKAVQ